MNDWMDDPEAQAWAQHVLDDVVPKIQDSGLTMSVVPHGETDIKFAVELGVSIMLDKPIVLVFQPGQTIPDHLRRVADGLIEMTGDRSRDQVSVQTALRNLGVLE